MKFYYATNIFDLHILDNEPTAHLKLFENSVEMHFISLFFLNERNITTLLLMIRLKCAVVRYANRNSSPINKPYLRAIEHAIEFTGYFVVLFFWILIYFYFNKVFVEIFMKKLSFLIQIFKNKFKM